MDSSGDKISTLAVLGGHMAGTLVGVNGACAGMTPSRSMSDISAIQCDLPNLSSTITALVSAATATINATATLEEDQAALDYATVALQAALEKIEGDIDDWVAAS
jgi:hypothetical protein